MRATSMQKYFVIKGLVFTFTQQISGVNITGKQKKWDFADIRSDEIENVGLYKFSSAL